MEKRRTVPVKLAVNSDDAALLEDTVDEFLWAANYVTRHAFDGEYVMTRERRSLEPLDPEAVHTGYEDHWAGPHAILP